LNCRVFQVRQNFRHDFIAQLRSDLRWHAFPDDDSQDRVNQHCMWNSINTECVGKAAVGIDGKWGFHVCQFQRTLHFFEGFFIGFAYRNNNKFVFVLVVKVFE